MRQRLAVYILAGGHSRRFGSDKARAEVHGVPLIVRIAREITPIADGITVVAEREGKYADLGFRTIPDIRAGQGPLGGLQAAIHDLRDDGWLLLVSCDAVAVRRPWIDLLLSARENGAMAVAFRHDRWEPLLALYHTAVRLEVDRRIADGELAMQRLLDGIRTVALPLPEDWPALCHVNTPAELDQYLSTKVLSTKEGPQEMTMAENKEPAKLPGTFKLFVSKYPALGAAHENIAKAVDAAGPLDRKTCELIKIGLSVGAGLETATRSHVRRAMEHGASESEIEQAILLAYNTCGFPRTVMAWQWARQQIERELNERKEPR